MSKNKVCEKSKKCPIYSGILNSNDLLIGTYKDLYCESTQENIEKCKRYQVSRILGYCPDNILPNSHMSVEEIVKTAKQQESENK